MEKEQLVTLTADIVAAHVSNNIVRVNEIGELVKLVHAALEGLDTEERVEEPQPKTPVVSVRQSIKPDFIICMECGKKQRTLKRHLQTAHGMTPDQYRQDYGLPKDYPMAAPNYSQQRRELAHSLGLGRKKGKGNAGGAEPAAERKPRGRKKTEA